MKENIKSIKFKETIEKINKISKELNDIFVEREDVIENSLKSLITGQSVLLIGPPGTAKSALTSELCSRIKNGRYFSWLLNRTSDPSEILGPFSIKQMEEDKFFRVTKNKLPEAEIVFLDEIFKCNEPTLNILLPIINEKIFYNDGMAYDVPLVTLFAASNEFPEEDSLMALYDRMIFRMFVDYIGDVQNKMTMFKRYLKRNNNIEATHIDMEEIAFLKETLEEVQVPEEMLKEYIYLMNTLMQEGVTISDRRQNEGLKVLKATALLKGKNIVNIEDFKGLKDILWNKIEDIEIIEEVLRDRLLNPYDKEYNRIAERYENLVNSTKNLTDNRMLVEIKGSVELLENSLKNIMKNESIMEKNTSRKFNSIKREIESFIETISSQIDEDGMDM